MDPSAPPVRSLVLWFPDWPITALARDGTDPLDPSKPIAVLANNAVVACSAAARAEGVRRGQRRRDAQALCPSVTIVSADPVRDHRAFAPVVSVIEERVPGVQIVRPGLCALRARGPARYYGGEVEAARVLIDVLAAHGLEGVQAGIADGPFTAEQVARSRTASADPVRVIPGGESAAFLAPLSVAVLSDAAFGSFGGGFDSGSGSGSGFSSSTGSGRASRSGSSGTSGSGRASRSTGSGRASRSTGSGSGTGSGGGPGRASASTSRDGLVELLARLGVQTLGEFAALDAERVRDRFGERGIRLQSLAAGRDSRGVDPRIPPPELQREVAFEPPLEIADQVAFGMRIAADEFIAGIGGERLVCTELRVEIVGERGERSERVWLHPASFDAVAVVDRVRWQLSEAQGDGGLHSGVALVRLEPAAVDAASHHTPGLFGAGPEERVHHALSRVQAMLGHRGVLTSAIDGGRWLAERQVLVPWGDRAVLSKDRARPWPGSLPDPLPTTVFPELRVADVTAADGAAIAVDERGVLTAAPAVLTEGGRRRAVVAWAGPWPVVERGWDAARRRRAHRFQIVDADQAAWLLVWEDGVWHAEARYD